MSQRQLPWQRLERSYHADDDLVLARREFGLVAEVFFTRLLAHGKPVRAPQDQEGEVLAAVLGFDPGEGPLIGLIVDWFVGNGTISRKRSPGRIAEGKARITVFDLSNRGKYRPPDRFLTRSERTSIPAKAEVDRISGRDTSSRDSSRDSSHTYERTDVRTNEPTSAPDTSSAGDAEGEPSPAPSRSDRAGAKVRRDPLFEALVDAMGWNMAELTKPSRSQLNAAAKQLRDVGATPEDVGQRADTYRKRHPDWTFTPLALSKHWADLAGGKTNPSVEGKREDLGVAVGELFGSDADRVVSRVLARAPIEGNDLDSLIAEAWRLGRRELGLEGDADAWERRRARRFGEAQDGGAA